METIKDNLPYEKFIEYGPESLSESELLAIILRTGTKDCNAIELAGKILALGRYPREGILALHDISLEELMSVKGIGKVKAIKVKCIAELSVRMNRAKAKEGLLIRNSATVAQYYMERLRHRDTECVYLLCLDAKGQLIREQRLSDGSVNMSLLPPREIFLTALQYKAVNIILLHNHPSGDPTPSRADKEITGCIREMGEKLEIPLLDHIIIGDNRYTSFKELGLL